MKLVPVLLFAWIGAAMAAVEVPAFTAFHSPDPNRGARRGDDGVLAGWRESTTLSWFGKFEKGGKLEASIRLADGAAGEGDFSLEIGAQADSEKVTRLEGKVEGGVISFGSAELAGAGYHRLTLTGKGGNLPGLASLVLAGEASDGAHFSEVERRNCASVHLGYPAPEAIKDEVEWFYLEVTPKTEPLWSYYEATGWHRGYFGMQVNSPTERRIIFSVWDAGDEAVDRRKVDNENRVKLLGKGEGVNAGDFGNEGTGGHSHLVYPWKLGDTVHFLMRAQPAEGRTVYTGWFRDSKALEWRLVSSFSAPKDGKYLDGLYSFNENFNGANGHEQRVCEFGNGWLRSASGEWHPLLKARFTHDGHGKSERLDRSAGIAGKRFYLKNGGFLEDETPGAVVRAYDALELPESEGTHPTDAELENLPQP